MNYKNLKEMPIWQMTGAEFLELQKLATPTEMKEVATTTDVNLYVYGLRGIRELFKCSHVTAQRLKDTILAPAVIQCGRKIMIDRQKAVELFNQNKKRK